MNQDESILLLMFLKKGGRIPVLKITEEGPVAVFKMGRSFGNIVLYHVHAFLISGTLIDSGTRWAQQELCSALEKRALATIINTHHHEDHCGNNYVLQTRHNAQILAHPEALPYLARPEKNALRFYQRLVWGYPEAVKGISIGSTFAAGKYNFDVISTPGHCADHICLHEANQGWLFTGDIFCGRRFKYLRSDEDYHQILASLQKLAALDFDTIFCSLLGTVKDAKAALLTKIERMENLKKKAAHMHRNGFSVAKISQELLGREGIMRHATGGHFAKKNTITSILRERESSAARSCRSQTTHPMQSGEKQGEQAQRPQQSDSSYERRPHGGDKRLIGDNIANGIAIIGMACRLPGGVTTPGEYWELLVKGQNAVGEVPENRWDKEALYDANPGTPGKVYVKKGGFLDDVEGFDAHFFEISPGEVSTMDPQQRILLEVAWEAFEHAGIPVGQREDSQTGVFVGVSSFDYTRRAPFARNLNRIDHYMGTNVALSAAAGRISYFMGLKGPCMSVDTACSSSLVTVHLACNSLLLGECDTALAGGVNLLLSPESTIYFSRLGVLSKSSACRTFDAGADGIVRSEGCGLVLLKRLSDALADGNHVIAVIRGSAVNQDGRSNGLTAPNGPSQQAVIRQALKRARVRANQMAYVEAHGTGTPLGDPIEAQALNAVFQENRTEDSPLIVGSVKTNIGHTEAAAGVAGLIKTALMMQHEQIPGNLHFSEISPYISSERFCLQVPTALQNWPRAAEPRLAGVSSFGFTGTNAHVVLQEAPEPAAATTLPERSRHLVTLSARSRPALEAYAGRYCQHLLRHPDHTLADMCHAANRGKTLFDHRLAVVATSKAEMADRLDTFSKGQTSPVCLYRRAPALPPRVAFLFSGGGSQYVNMGRQLYEAQPVFKEAMDHCARILKVHLEMPLLAVLYPDQGNRSPLDDNDYMQPALFSIEYALYRLWVSWGVKPDVVMGHSTGEYAAACSAGVFSLEDGLLLLANRSRLMQKNAERGRMAVLRTDIQTVENLVRKCPGVSIAADNGPDNIVISGVTDEVDAICHLADSMGVDVKPLKVSVAAHSPLMVPLLKKFETFALTVRYAEPNIGFVSSVTGNRETDFVASPAYWVKHLEAPVRFSAGARTLGESGCRVLIEIGPHPTLLGMTKACLPTNEASYLPSLRRETDNWQTILDSLGEYFTLGGQIDGETLDRPYARNRLETITYPFQREQYPLDAAEQKNETSRAPIVSNNRVENAEPSVMAPQNGDALACLALLDHTEDSIEFLHQFLTEQLAFVLRCDQAQISPTAHFKNLGVDSLRGLEYKMTLETTFCVQLPPESVWKYPNIDKLARYILEMVTDGQQSRTTGTDDLTSEHPWFSPVKTAENPALRLICFPYAGGSSTAFMSWPAKLPPDIEVCCLETPGKYFRADECPITDFQEIISLMGREIVAILDAGKTIFFGHSLGALMAVELAHWLGKKGYPMPSHLLLSGLMPLSMLQKQTVEYDQLELYLLTQLRQRISADPALASRKEDLMALILPALQSDLNLLQTWKYLPKEKLNLPITVFNGSEDALVPRDCLKIWEEQSCQKVDIRVVDGDHLYLHQETSVDFLLTAISEIAQRYLIRRYR